MTQTTPANSFHGAPLGTRPALSGGNSPAFQAAPAAGALGLVHSSTSDTPTPIDPKKARLKRMKQGVLTAARLHTEQATKGGTRYLPVMLTLTYAHDGQWNPRHIADLMKHVRQWMARRGALCRYAWVMELTKGGRPHYHVMFWLPRGLSLPKPDKRGWWPHGSTRVERARNAVGYMAKYCSKGADKGPSFPDGARIHGCGGLDVAARNERSWWLCPAWVRERWPDPAYKPRVSAGGGWYSLETGDWEPSPYSVTFSGGLIYISRNPQGADFPTPREKSAPPCLSRLYGALPYCRCTSCQ